jgi:hypothetical protein
MLPATILRNYAFFQTAYSYLWFQQYIQSISLNSINCTAFIMQIMFSVKNGFLIIQGVSGGTYCTPGERSLSYLRRYNQTYLYLKLNVQDEKTQKKKKKNFLQFCLLYHDVLSVHFTGPSLPHCQAKPRQAMQMQVCYVTHLTPLRTIFMTLPLVFLT